MRTLLKKAVIAAAGLGTRLLPATKEQPKEMLPILHRSMNGGQTLKPLLQVIFENLYDYGFREFCFVIGRAKRMIEDHFTSDNEYLKMLKSRGKSHLVADLEGFFRKLEDSNIMWLNQPRPLGLGDAVRRAKAFFGDEEFLIQAGDTYIISKENQYLRRLNNAFYEEKADAALTILPNCQGQYDSIVGGDAGGGMLRVDKTIKKGCEQSPGLAIIPVHIMKPNLIDLVQPETLSAGSEVELADIIQASVEKGARVLAVPLMPGEDCLDIGTPENYLKAIRLSAEMSSGN